MATVTPTKPVSTRTLVTPKCRPNQSESDIERDPKQEHREQPVSFQPALERSVAESMRQGEVSSIQRAQRKLIEGISHASSAQDSLKQTANLLIRMRARTQQYASSAPIQKTMLQIELRRLLGDIQRSSDETRVHTEQLIASISASQILSHTGVIFDDHIFFDADNSDETTLGVSSKKISQATNNTAIAAIDTSITKIERKQSVLDSIIKELIGIATKLGKRIGDTIPADPKIRDEGVASQTARESGERIVSDGKGSVPTQANTQSQSAFTLLKLS